MIKKVAKNAQKALFIRREEELKMELISEMQQKLQKLVLPRGFSCFPALIHVNGVQESVIEKEYFLECIDFWESLL